MKTLLSKDFIKANESGIVRRFSISLEFKLEDLWIGVFFKKEKSPFDDWTGTYVWICLLPCLPIHLMLRKYRY